MLETRPQFVKIRVSRLSSLTEKAESVKRKYQGILETRGPRPVRHDLTESTYHRQIYAHDVENYGRKNINRVKEITNMYFLFSVACSRCAFLAGDSVAASGNK